MVLIWKLMKCHICDVKSTFAQTTWIIHLKCIKLCPFDMLMKCPFDTNMDVKWTYMTSPFDIHVDVEWIHVMSIWHSYGCQMDLFMYIWHPYWCLVDLHDFYWTCTWDVKWTNEGVGWELWHVIRTCSAHGLGHDNNNVLRTWVRLWKQ
jgi:hypothetical protein